MKKIKLESKSSSDNQAFEHTDKPHCMQILFLIVTLITCCQLQGECPAIKMSDEIQNQFQIIFKSDINSLSNLPSAQSLKLNQLLDLNSDVLTQFSCFFDQGHDPMKLKSNMNAMKLQILQFRNSLSQKEWSKAESALFQLKSMMDIYLTKPSQLARRLGASARSLYLDELEKTVSFSPELVRKQIQPRFSDFNISHGVELEMRSHWQALISQFSPQQLTPEGLARHFSRRAWTVKSMGTLHLPKWLSRMKSQSENETLESQLLILFKASPNSNNIKNVNFNISESESVIKHYVALTIQELKKNNYFAIKDWLSPVIQDKVKNIKTEMGASWPLISPLMGVSLEGELKEITVPIELLTSNELAKAEKSYSKIRNPIGHLYEIVMLKTLMELWTKADITQLRSDYDRLESLNTLLAIQSYQKTNARWPSSIQDLVQQKYLIELPKDHFIGKELKINPQQKQVWSVGENGIDENGNGDDIGIKVSI